MKPQYDVIVIGGGHAGVEAAMAAERMGVQTLLITHKTSMLGEMSCNPAIGGLGKGHLVREIDALDGVMGLAADLSGIQFRLLNRSKGAAVQGPRTQIDRQVYKSTIQKMIKERINLTVLEKEVVDVIVQRDSATGVIISGGIKIYCSALILTTGTFLKGTIHIGKEKRSGGRIGDKASESLAEKLYSLNLPMGRLKTGTPPRIDGNTIDWDLIEFQEADTDPSFFSFFTKSCKLKQVSCGITYTNEKTHSIIRDNLEKSAMYGGSITSLGPRYCPSIEDKIVRFSNKESHQIFLEPEGLNTDVVYPNGISTSLPIDVQKKYVNSILGLERAKIIQPGYAIEYDFIDPRSLTPWLELKKIKGFFLAGQINGTTGYEEAAGQGLLAGLNAALFVQGKKNFSVRRDEGYLGVMIDDLVTKGVKEPYRMFTSRAEYRLCLRADNADQRLTQVGINLGCVSISREKLFIEAKNLLTFTKKTLEALFLTSNQAKKNGLIVKMDGKTRNAIEYLASEVITYDKIISIWPEIKDLDLTLVTKIVNDYKYSFYIERQKKEIQKMKRDEAIGIPSNIEYENINGISNELLSKLQKVRPINLAQALRIDGMTPAAITLILFNIRKLERLNHSKKQKIA